MSERSEHVYDLYMRYVNPGLAQLMKFAGFGVESHAEGMYIYDDSGRSFLDFLGGYGVFAVGHRHPAVVEAVHRQLDRMPLGSKVLFSDVLGEFCEALASVTPGELTYSFICNSGTEAIEGAIKVARSYTGREKFICAKGGFHGKSMGALSATGREQYKTAFEPLVPGFVHVPFNDIGAAAEAIDDQTAGVIIEPIQGEGGIHVATAAYLPELRTLCTQRGALLIADEVQTGMGRTGRMFACEHYGVTPDIMTLAKALGGGVIPSGAVVSTPDIWSKVFGENPLVHTSTFGGNPLACAAGLATLKVLRDEDLVTNAARRGEQLLAGLRSLPDRFPGIVRDVRGMGLMAGVEFELDDVGKLVISGLNHRGVIAAYTLNNPRVIRMEPPLIVSEQQIDQALQALTESVEEAWNGLKSLGLL